MMNNKNDNFQQTRGYRGRQYNHDYTEYNDVDANVSPRDKAYIVACALLDAIKMQASDEIFSLRHKLLGLLVQLDFDTKQLFRQWIFLDKMSLDKTGDISGARLYDTIAPLIEASRLSKANLQTYISFDILSNECEHYRNHNNNCDDLGYQYNNLKPTILQIVEGTACPSLKRELKLKMKLVERCIKHSGKPVARRQRLSSVPAKKKTASTPISANPSSFMDRIAKLSGIRF